MKKNFINVITVAFSIIFLELISQGIILTKEKKYSLFFKFFFNSNLLDSDRAYLEYKIKWDYKNNKMLPGVYKNKTIKYSINSKGFRGKEFNFNKDKKKRIIAFGGSTTLGLESPDALTYPSQLEYLLNKNKNNYEVINMGFSGKSLNFIKQLFFIEAHKYEPDIIVIYNNRNSIMYDSSYVDPKFENNNFLKINYFLQENIMTYRLVFKIYKRSSNLFLNSNYLKSPISNKGVSKEYLLNGYSNSLLEIINFSKKKNIKVILVKYAYMLDSNLISEINNFTPEELIEKYINSYFLKKYKVNKTDLFWAVMGTILNKKLEELKNQNNVVVVDPTQKLLKLKSNFTDFIHLTPAGNLVLAEEIFKEINKR